MELLFIAILGLLIGSFLNVVIIRVPQGKSISFPASHCVKCHTPLKPWHNVPLFSWLFLKGQCAFCGDSISKQYPIIEALSALVFTAVFLKMGISLPTFGVASVFLLLLALSVIDFKYKAVPDSLNLLALFLSIISVWSMPMFVHNFVNALIFAGGFTLLRFILSYYLSKRAQASQKSSNAPWTQHYHTYPFIEAMGEADIMIAATMGALLGAKLALVAIFISAILALPAMLLLADSEDEESKRVAFVPFLSVATFIVYLLDTPIMNYLDRLYG